MFTEQNTVENYLVNLLTGVTPPPVTGRESHEPAAPYLPLGRSHKAAGWHYVPSLSLPRRVNDVFIEPYLRQALIRLNPMTPIVETFRQAASA